jgi:ribonuclease HIII
MKVKHLKTKVVIETSKEDYNELVKRINQLNRMISTIHEINDLYLSDITTLEKLQYEMVDLLDLGWSSDNYRYVVQEEDK